MAIGGLIGALVVLVDIMLKGFSLRGFSAFTFGLILGTLVAHLIATSPLFEQGDPAMIYLVRLALYIICAYLGAVIAFRGKDEFNFVIPYVRFVPHDVEVPLAVLDTSALIDGRVVDVCESQFLTSALVVPQFVIDELQRIADSRDALRQAKGRRGLDTLNRLRAIQSVDLRIQESGGDGKQSMDDRLIFLTRSLKAKLMTTDANLAKLAQFHGIPWLNLTALSKALHPQLLAGESIEVDLVKAGREPGQGVGYLSDGSMVVVQDGHPYVGARVAAEITSVMPSAGGKLVFAKFVSLAEADAK